MTELQIKKMVTRTEEGRYVVQFFGVGRDKKNKEVFVNDLGGYSYPYHSRLNRGSSSFYCDPDCDDNRCIICRRTAKTVVNGICIRCAS